MIKLVEFQSEDLEQDVLTSDIGEIFKIEDVSYQGCGLKFSDSKGFTFTATTNWNAVRYFSLCTIYDNFKRNDLIPSRYKKKDRSIHIACNDPRVVWACIISLWITNKTPNSKIATKEARSKTLTSLLPTYQDASVWLVKNRFKPFATKDDYNATRNTYLSNYSALVTPPDIDWSIFPDQNDN